jgi:hypothetical protein
VEKFPKMNSPSTSIATIAQHAARKNHFPSLAALSADLAVNFLTD